MAHEGPESGDAPSTDPQDAQFGRQAREKEEKLDEALSRGEAPPDESAEQRPRAAGKADEDGEK